MDANTSNQNTNFPDLQGWRYTQNTTTYIFAAVLITLIATRLLTGINSTTKPVTAHHGSAQKVPAVPYWIPILGHLPNMAWDADTFIKSLRQTYTQGIFALNFGGTTHNIISTPGLATALLNQKITNADNERVSHRIMTDVFGLPRSEKAVWESAWRELNECYRFLLTEPTLGEMVGRTVQKVRENVVFLVTGASSPVDQMLWERTSDIRIKTNGVGDEVVEASLLPLVRDFCAHTANPTIMGSNFLAKFPDFFDDLWTLDRAFLLLGAGIPHWFPIPMLTRAHLARKKMLDALYVFHEAMEKEAKGQDPGPDWRDLEDVSTLVKERTKAYRKYGLSIRARAASELALSWAANANSNVLIFWIVNRIYADSDLLARVREEIAPYAKAVQPKQELSIPEPPRLESFDVEGLCSNCPLLKSCYVECLRMDTASWSLKEIKQDFVLQSREKDAQGWLLMGGSYAHAAHDLHNTDPLYFQDPMTWKADRHIQYGTDEKTGTVVLGSIRPYGGGNSMCKGRAFAFKEVMAFSAAIIASWDIEPAGGGKWEMPRHRKATGVYGTSDDTRVAVKRRELTKTN